MLLFGNTKIIIYIWADLKNLTIMSSIFEYGPVNPVFKSPTPGVISIVAGIPNEGDSPLDDELCQQLSECGFNAAAAVISTNNSGISTSLENCYNHGISLFIGNGNLYNQYLTPFIDSYKNRKGLGGWFMKLNLSPKELENINTGKDTSLLDSYNKIKKSDPDHPTLLGLGGDWNLDRNGDAISSYPDYVAKFQKKFEPSFWPILFFPDVMKGKETDVPEARQLMFYKTLQYFAYISRFTSTPFWFTCRCQAFKDYNGYNAQAPTLSMLRGIVFTALAYGAQGIYYWNYRQNYNSGSTVFSDAPVKLNGLVKNDTIWDIVKTVNKEIQDYNKIFCGCEVIDCRHVTKLSHNKSLKTMDGTVTDTVDDSLRSLPMGPLTGVSYLGTDLLISHIFNNEENYLVIVNDPFHAEILDNPIKKQVRFNFNFYWKIYRCQSENGVLTQTEITNNLKSYTLNPGDYLIFKWE